MATLNAYEDDVEDEDLLDVDERGDVIARSLEGGQRDRYIVLDEDEDGKEDVEVRSF